MKLLTFLLCLLFADKNFAQTNPTEETRIQDSIFLITHPKYGPGQYAITRDTLNRFPDSLDIKGQMIDYTMGVTCGVVCGCGTLKIKLLEKNKLYDFDTIYVTIPCFDEMDPSYEKATSWKLYKLQMKEHKCFFTDMVSNKFDTKGLPFYLLERNLDNY